MEPGSYCLIIRNPELTTRIGALGLRTLDAGWHVYVGSALGPGGLRRADRHIGLYRARDRPPRWHIDHLLLHPDCRLEAVARIPSEARVECRLAAMMPGKPVPGFGSSDCGCGSHLFLFTAFPAGDVRAACEKLDLLVTITMIEYTGR